MRALQAQEHIEAPVISGIDIIQPARFGAAGVIGDAVEELLGQGMVPHQFARAVQLPGDRVDVTVFLDKGVDAVEAVSAPRRHSQPAPSQAAAADVGVRRANEDAVAVDARGTRAVAETGGQHVGDADIVGGHVTAVGQGDVVSHGRGGRHGVGRDGFAQGDDRIGYSGAGVGRKG